MRPWKLDETNYGHVKDHAYEVAVLPFGATEPHNLHLPYGIDTIEGGTIGERICEAAHDRGAKVVLLPTVPYGTQTNQKELPLAMNLYPSTIAKIVHDLVESLVRTGIRKILLLNSHGGNDFKWILREMYGQTPAHLFVCNWYTVFMDVYDEIFDVRDEHAGEMETSFALAYCPELVARNDDGTLTADDAKNKKSRFAALENGWVSITRPFHLLVENAGTADPHAATAVKGEQMMNVVVERLSQFLVELSEAEVDDKFPY